MGRTIRVSMTVLMAAMGLALVASRVSAQTVDEIVARNIQAKGGAEKIKAVQSMKQASHIKIQGMSATMTTYFKRPNLSRQEMSIAGAQIIAAFDGTTAWGINPMAGQTTPQPLPGASAEQARREADFDPPLLDYKTKGTKVEFVGTEPAGGGKSYLHLTVTDKQGTVTQVYLDSTTALEAKIVAQGPTGPIETALSDYRDVNGLKLPFAIKTTTGGVVAADVVVDSIQFNVDMPATLFSMPKGQ
jgi:outer membrane lipoprotein-sorting protein